MVTLPGPLARAIELRGRDLTVLVVRLGALGDILRTVPAVRLIRRALPESRIHWLVEPPWNAALEGHPDLDGVWVVPRREWATLASRPGSWTRLVASLRGFGRRLRGLGAGLVLDFHGNLRSGILGRWSGATARMGYAGHEQKEGNRWFTNLHVPSGDRRTPRMERNLSLVRALGLPDRPLPDCALALVDAGGAAAREVLDGLPSAEGGLAVLAPGASQRQAYKRPPVPLLAAACARLSERSILPLVVWGPGEQLQARDVVEASGGRGILAPPTSLPALAALLDRSRVFVGGDTGPMHLACAVGCPVLAIYGPTDPLVNRPWGGAFRVVSPVGRRYTGIKRIDREAGGFDSVSEAQVTNELDRLLDESDAARRAGL